MSVAAELGDVLDVAVALGIVESSGGEATINADWFSDPGRYVRDMLRDSGQRDALLEALDSLLGSSAPLDAAGDGRAWVQVVSEGSVGVFLVLEADGAAGGSVLGLGATVTTSTSPETDVRLYVPLLAVPASGAPTVLLGTADGTASLSVGVVLDEVASGSAPGIAGVRLAVDVATDGSSAGFSATLEGLQLPGEQAPADVELSGATSAADLETDAIRLVLGLLHGSLDASTAAEVTALLQLLGLGGVPEIPALPVADLLSTGRAAWSAWLDQILASEAALQAVADRLATLVGASTPVAAPAAGEPFRIDWTLAGGAELTLLVTAGTAAGGARTVEVGLEGTLAAPAGSGPPATVALTAVLADITLGSRPSVQALPSLALTARLGDPSSGAAPLYSLTSPEAISVGWVEAGVGLDDARRPGLVLAAHDVTIGSHTYAVLDLTNVQTVLAAAADAVEGDVLGLLGSAADDVRVLIGLSAPAAGPTPWPVVLTPAVDLLADPPAAILAYHRRLIGEAPADYPAVLASLADLLGVSGAVGSGSGTEEKPWAISLADGADIVVWVDGSPAQLHVGVRASQSLTDLGGGCPTLTFELVAELLRIATDGTGARPLPAAHASARFGARGGVPIRVGAVDAALSVDSVGIRLSWDGSVSFGLDLPGLAAVVDGISAPIALPELQADGTFSGEVPWRAIELLSGYVLSLGGTAWGEELVGLLGWLTPGGPATPADGLALELLVADPLSAFEAWVVARAGPRELDRLLGWLALLLTGEAGPGLAAGVLSGRAGAAAPTLLRLSPVAEELGLSLGLWSSGADLDPLAFKPGDLVAALDAGTPAMLPDADRLVGALADAALASSTLDEALSGREDTLAEGVAALVTRWTDTDGLVAAGDAVLDGAEAHELADAGNLRLPELVDLASVVGFALPASTVYVTGPYGVDSWPGVDASQVVDLTAAGLAPEAFDVSGLATQDGPWLVKLPSRADAVVAAGEDGTQRQADRLARAVAQVAARAAGETQVVVAAHGAAGHAAATVAADPASGITHLVTLGTAHGGLALDELDAQPAAGALQLLGAIVPALDADVPEHAAVGLGRDLAAPFQQAYEADGSPLDDLAPPATAPVPADTVEVHCVYGRIDGDAVLRGLSGLVVRALEDAYGTLSDESAGVEVDVSLGHGLTVQVTPATADGDVRVQVELSVVAAVLGSAPSVQPGLRARVQVDRPGGWLAGGPDPSRAANVSRQPSLRAAALELELPLGAAAVPVARIVLYEAEALGVRAARWELGTDDAAESLQAEERILIGRLASALGPLPSSGPRLAVAQLLGALGVLEPGTAATPGADVAFSVDGVQQLLVDPASLVRDATSAAGAPDLAAALATLLGAPPPAPSAPAEVVVEIDGVQLTIDVAARSLRVDTAGDGLALASGLTLAGGFALDGAGLRDIRLELGNAAASALHAGLELTGPPWALRLDAGPTSIEIAPSFDPAGIDGVLAALVPAQVMWAAVSFLRQLDSGVTAIVDPLLEAAGLLAGSGDGARVVVPYGLLADPAGWLGSRLTDAAALADLLDALGTVVGVPRTADGGWQLPYGLGFAAGAGSDGRPALSLSFAEQTSVAAAAAAIRADGTVSLVLAAAGKPAEVEVDVSVGLAGSDLLAKSNRIEIHVAASGVTAQLFVSGNEISLLPPGGGLASLAKEAAGLALPYVLNAIVAELATLSPPGSTAAAAIRDLGSALDLVDSSGAFDDTKLQTFAKAPSVGFDAAALSALEALAGLVKPASWVVASDAAAGTLTVSGPASVFSVRLSVPPSGGTPTVTVSLDGLTLLSATTLSGTVTLDASGLAAADLSLANDPATPLAFGLAPCAELSLGATSTLAVGLCLDGGGQVRAAIELPAGSVALELVDAPPGLSTVDAALELLVPVVADLALSTSEVQSLLGHAALGVTVFGLLDGPVLSGSSSSPALVPGALDPARIWSTLLAVAANLAAHSPSILVAPLTLGIASRGSIYGLSLGLAPGERFPLAAGDVTVDLEVDASWIADSGTTPGIVLDLLDLSGSEPSPHFGLEIRGVGVRVGRSSGALLDSAVTIDSVALHGLLAIDAGAGVTLTEAGGQLELTDLRVPLTGAQGGDNQVASGMLGDTTSNGTPPDPRFSPALAVQRDSVDGAVTVDLRAGDGNGPWWVAIQRGFGPVYVEQVGFGVDKDSTGATRSVSVLVDGNVSLCGFTAAVEDLGLQASWPNVFDPSGWSAVLDGLGVSANTGGVEISGGLERTPGTSDYVGMILVRFGVYGLTAYGGYSVSSDSSGSYTSFFLFGALVAPLGGPPAFFVTGIGAGVGVNRLLVVPADLSDFGTYPFLQALDPSAPLGDPMQELTALRADFPAQRGAFWLAAGLSFTSFALIECVAVVSVAISDGLDIDLMGLARAALPTAASPLVELELAVLVRFSSKDGVIWAQGQLTDNSYLLTKDCRLTGGFAYVLWFSGPNAGEFVVTLGGYHPSFHRDDYPVVPRLGFVWSVSDALVIKGQSYFALTSEAIMAGTSFEARLDAGPLWASMSLGADGIVFFDPFKFHVSAYAELAAGITIDVDLLVGHVRKTFSVSLHANVDLEGPPFHGSATIDLDITSVTISFGDAGDDSTPVLDWVSFNAKYLSPNGSRVLTVVPGTGLVPPSSTDSQAPATGADGDPFLLLPEFQLTITTAAATSTITAGGDVAIPAVEPVAIGPMHVASVESVLSVGVLDSAGTDLVGSLERTAIVGAFPKGIWGPQPSDAPVPTGKTMTAGSGLALRSSATISVGTVAIDEHRVEVGTRLPLPFLAESAVRGDLSPDRAAAAAAFAKQPQQAAAAIAAAERSLQDGPLGQAWSRVKLATFARTRVAPPVLAPLTLGLAGDPVRARAVAVRAEPAPSADARAVPQVLAWLRTPPSRAPRAQPATTLTRRQAHVPRVLPPTLAETVAGRASLPARLVRRPASAQRLKRTVAPAAVPYSGRAGTGVELRRRPGAPQSTVTRLTAIERALAASGFSLGAGESVVVGLPDAAADVGAERPRVAVSGPLASRVVAIDCVGSVVCDSLLQGGHVSLPAKTERFAVIGGATLDGMRGWHATTRLLQVGARAFAGPGCTLEVRDRPVRRNGREVSTSFVAAAQVVAGSSIATTRFDPAVTAVAVALESDGGSAAATGALDLGLAGATRATVADGTQAPPQLVVAGGCVFAVYDVVADRNADAVAVTVASDASIGLAAVVASSTSAAQLADQLVARGLDGLLSNLVADSEDVATVRWHGPGGTGTVAKRKAVA